MPSATLAHLPFTESCAQLANMPAKPEPPQRVIIPMSASLIEKIDDYRFERRLLSRAEAIRQLIEAGLKVKKSKNHPPER
jgi:hypothetical protein